jgi:hypothetical protein
MSDEEECGWHETDMSDGYSCNVCGTHFIGLRTNVCKVRQSEGLSAGMSDGYSCNICGTHFIGLGTNLCKVRQSDGLSDEANK